LLSHLLQKLTEFINTVDQIKVYNTKMNANHSNDNANNRKDGAVPASHFRTAPSFRMNFSYGPSKIGSAPVVMPFMQGGGVSDLH